MHTILALVGVVGVGAVAVAMIVTSLVPELPRLRLRLLHRRRPALSAGDPWGPIEAMEPVDLALAPADTRGLVVWEHPRTGERLECLTCRDGWLWLWRLPQAGRPPEVVLAECRCGLIWRLGESWHGVQDWASDLPEDRRPRPHRGSARARHLAALIHRAVQDGEPEPWWWSRWRLVYDDTRHAHVCPRCWAVAPNPLYEPEADAEGAACGVCGRLWRPAPARHNRWERLLGGVRTNRWARLGPGRARP